MKILKIFLLLSIGSIFSYAHAETYDLTVEPGNVYNMAAFRMWTPDAKKFRGILMLNPGSNGDGRPQVEDQYWQDFAKKHNFALLATYLTDHKHPNMMIEDYIQVGKGSGRAILDAIDYFAKESG
ncbi:MAG TPA: hypothetical protein P5227_07105, partial [Emcibacteraceae bacterium]|nr:hypothetical protein [Emcibacteraceae bacterium]